MSVELVGFDLRTNVVAIVRNVQENLRSKLDVSAVAIAHSLEPYLRSAMDKIHLEHASKAVAEYIKSCSPYPLLACGGALIATTSAFAIFRDYRRKVQTLTVHLHQAEEKCKELQAALIAASEAAVECTPPRPQRTSKIPCPPPTVTARRRLLPEAEVPTPAPVESRVEAVESRGPSPIIAEGITAPEAYNAPVAYPVLPDAGVESPMWPQVEPAASMIVEDHHAPTDLRTDVDLVVLAPTPPAGPLPSAANGKGSSTLAAQPRVPAQARMITAARATAADARMASPVRTVAANERWVQRQAVPKVQVRLVATPPAERRRLHAKHDAKPSPSGPVMGRGQQARGGGGDALVAARAARTRATIAKLEAECASLEATWAAEDARIEEGRISRRMRLALQIEARRHEAPEGRP